MKDPNGNYIVGLTPTYPTPGNSTRGSSDGGEEQVFNTYPAAPADVSKAALSYPAGGGTLYQFDVGSQTWV